MTDLEFRSQTTPPEKWRARRFGDVGDSVPYHSLLRLASPQQVLSQWSEIATICSSGLPPQCQTGHAREISTRGGGWTCVQPNFTVCL